MEDKTKRGAGSKIIRERAMAVLRDTRAKIDPAFLAVMKEHFSAFTAGQGHQAKKQVGNKTSEFPAQSFDNLSPAKAEEKSEPVDKQKIAKIVLEYMKNKDNGIRH